MLSMTYQRLLRLFSKHELDKRLFWDLEDLAYVVLGNTTRKCTLS